MLGIDAHPGPALLLGLPGRARAERAPEGQQELLDLAQIGMTITDGYAPGPRAVDPRPHRAPPAGPSTSERARAGCPPSHSPDDVIMGSSRDPSLLPGPAGRRPCGRRRPGRAGARLSLPPARQLRAAPGRGPSARRPGSPAAMATISSPNRGLAKWKPCPNSHRDVLQPGDLAGGLDPLGDRLQVEDPRELDDRARELAPPRGSGPPGRSGRSSGCPPAGSRM